MPGDRLASAPGICRYRNEIVAGQAEPNRLLSLPGYRYPARLQVGNTVDFSPLEDSRPRHPIIRHPNDRLGVTLSP
jgi:hypothetical protein